MIEKDYVDGDFYTGAFIIKNVKVSKQLIKEVINYLLSIGFSYNETCIGSSSSAWKNSISESRHYDETELGKGNLEKAIDNISDMGGWINLGCKLPKSIIGVTVSIIQTENNVRIRFSMDRAYLQIEKNGQVYLRDDEDVVKELDKLAMKALQHFGKKYVCEIEDISQKKKWYEEHMRNLEKKENEERMRKSRNE